MRTRWIAVAHHLPERTRLRTPVIRKDEGACERIADVVAAIPGVREVKVRPYTGSVLVEHEANVEIGMLVDTLKRELAITHVLAANERPPIDPDVPALSSLARKVVIAAREIDKDLRRGTEGVIDLGTLAALGFVGAGAVDVATSRTIQLPPWFQLAWWAFRTFTTSERDEIDFDGEGELSD